MNDYTNTINEQWKTIDEFPDYEVSNFGRIRKNDLILKTPLNRNGYPRVHFFKDGKDHTKTVHRYVAKAFVPNPNDYPVVNHLDGNKENNYFENLEWTTSQKNTLHAIEIGLLNPYSVTDEEAKEIRMAYKAGATRKELAKKYDVSPSTIRNHTRYIYKRRPVPDELKEEIIRLNRTNLYSRKELSYLFDLPRTTVDYIINLDEPE